MTKSRCVFLMSIEDSMGKQRTAIETEAHTCPRNVLPIARERLLRGVWPLLSFRFCNKVLGEMPFLGITVFCFLLLIVTTSTHAVMEFNSDPFVRHSPESENGPEGNVPAERHRQKRQVAAPGLSPVKYKIDIEISTPDSSLLASIKDYFKNFSFPIIVKTPESTMNISSLSVTTVCSLTSNNETRCSCESGYGWPAAVCKANSTCPQKFPTQEEICDCITHLPSQGPYCQLQPGGIPPITIEMSVTLGVVFQDALRNSSSELYQTYKRDLENAFTASYKPLPGFISAKVTGFRPGSVIVDSEIKAGPAMITQIESASRNIPKWLTGSYMIDPRSLEITGLINFSVSPDDIFQGDTVKMTCEIQLDAMNVAWYHSEHVISNSNSISTIIVQETTKSFLTIANVTQDDAGPYACVFIGSTGPGTLSFKATHSITVAPINIVQSGDAEVVCNGTKVLLSCCTDGNIQSFTTNWNTTINILGTISFTPNCTEYTLQANQSQCPINSGTETMYTCELSTGHGARRSEAIRVTYLRGANVAISSSSKAQVSEGHNFSLTCTSDVSNCNVIWEIRSQKIDSGLYICNLESPSLARSVLTVKAASQAWNGTYTCKFFQNSLQSSASTTVEVVPLPAKQNIVLDPIQGFIQCNLPQVLKCCIDRAENYEVKFTVQQKELPSAKNTQGNQVCYTYNYTESCNSKSEVVAYCTFVNRIQDKVESSRMTLRIIPEKEVSCSGSIGVGQQGAEITKPCPASKDVTGTSIPVRGTIIYVCNKNNWNNARNSCISDQINQLLSGAEALVTGPHPEKKLPTYLETLHNNTIKEQQEINNSPANLGAVITILDLVSAIPTDAEPRTMTNFYSTVDIIVNSSTIPAWEDLNNQQTPKSSLLLDSVERFSRSLRPTTNIIHPITNTNLQLQGIVITENSMSDYNKTFTFSSSANLSGNVLINRSKIKNLEPNSTIISVAFSTLRYILPMANKTNEVNGLVMMTTTNSTLLPDFQISLTFAKSNSSLKEPKCVFWNFSLSDVGEWDGTGCDPKDDGDNIICTCSHLTSFSILMSSDLTSPASGTPLQSLDYITYIGLIISILSLVICILIESMVWKYVTKNRTSYMRHVCILNIAVSLLIADIWFIVAASIQDTKGLVNGNVCIAATFFVHLFYLSVFFWMLALGLMIFYRLVFILHDTSKSIQKAVAFSLGYGCPLIISVITIAVTQPLDAYRRENACWLNWEKSKALLAFVIPALIIVAVNSVIAIVILVKILRPAIGEKPNKQERSSLIQAIKNVATLTPLFGLTWGFGLATLGKDSSIVFHILFTLLNAFQGLFILVFGTLRDKKVIETLANKYSFARWSTQQTKSTSLGDPAPVFSMNSPFAEALNNLFGKAGKYKISSTETTGSCSEHTSNTYSVLH